MINEIIDIMRNIDDDIWEWNNRYYEKYWWWYMGCEND